MYPSSLQKMLEVQRVALNASNKSSDSTRHKCFISYHVADLEEVEQFVSEFATEFIPKSIGVTDDDDFINSDDEDYIKSRIRSEYLSDSTVTIVLLGDETYLRKYVDWEISSSLRNDPVNKRNGLLVIPLPSRSNSAVLPARVADNWVEGHPELSYASYRSYPASRAALRSDIENAFSARIAKSDLVHNSRALRRRNG